VSPVRTQQENVREGVSPYNNILEISNISLNRYSENNTSISHYNDKTQTNMDDVDIREYLKLRQELGITRKTISKPNSDKERRYMALYHKLYRRYKSGIP